MEMSVQLLQTTEDTDRLTCMPVTYQHLENN